MEKESALWQKLRNEETRLQAFEELVKLHYSRVKSWIRRWVADEALAEDLTQETFLKAWEKCHTFRGEAQFSSWLYTIARRKALAALHQHSLWKWVPWAWDLIERWEAPQEEPGREIEAVEADLANAVKELTPIQQAIWRAVWEEKKPYKVVAAQMGIRENTVKAHIHQIRRRLRKLFGME